MDTSEEPLETRAWSPGAAGPGDINLGVIDVHMISEAMVLGDDDDDDDISYRTLTALSALHTGSLNLYKSSKR